MDHLKYMQQAYEEALKAFRLREVPIGCVIARGDEIIGRGYNRRRTDKNVLAHAETFSLYQACQAVGDWRLEGCRLYVTVEPCPMCAGAIVQARMDEVIYAAANPKAGCAGSILNLLDVPRFNHQVRIVQGVMREECAELMKTFFRSFRKT
ncbi:MAG: nucleoside deaminase [Clostridiales bacterium]|nr:nucleoside deaminase [Clostridiales bacterium]